MVVFLAVFVHFFNKKERFWLIQICVHQCKFTKNIWKNVVICDCDKSWTELRTGHMIFMTKHHQTIVKGSYIMEQHFHEFSKRLYMNSFVNEPVT